MCREAVANIDVTLFPFLVLFKGLPPTEPVMAGVEPSSHPSASGANDKPDGNLKHTLRQQNQPLLLIDDSAVLECNTSGAKDGWTVQGDVKIAVAFLYMHSPAHPPQADRKSSLHARHVQCMGAGTQYHPCTPGRLMDPLVQLGTCHREACISCGLLAGHT